MTLAGSHLSSRCGPVIFLFVDAATDFQEEDCVAEVATAPQMRLQFGRHRTDDAIHVDAPLQNECLQRILSSCGRYCMLNLLRRLMGLSSGEIEALATPRSAGWRVLRKQHLGMHPECIVCGSRKKVVPHHVVPFHVDPSRELDPSNLVTLCESPTFNCHLFFGHLKRWDRYNPNVVEDAATWRLKISENSNP
jgi:5-methylcytosine-specific restriction enzyme A